MGEKEVTNNDKEVVSAFLAELASRIGKERFATWFGPEPSVDWLQGRLQIGVVNPFVRDWLKAKFTEEVRMASEATLGPTLEISFEVPDRVTSAVPAKGAPARRGGRTRRLRGPEEPQLFNGASGGGGHDSAFGPFKQPVQADCAAVRTAVQLGDIVVGAANQLAVTSAKVVTEQPGTMTPMFVYGPTAVGKTHLLHGIGNGLRQSRPSQVILRLSAEEFTCRFLEALNGSGLPSFRRKYRHLDCLLLDDVQFLKGKKATQVELVSTLEALISAKKQVVCTADRPPRDLDGLSDELKSRLGSGLPCAIEPPDEAMRRQLVRRFSEELRLALPDDVIELLVSGIRQHARAIQGALQKLRMVGQAFQRPITLDLARQSLADQFLDADRPITLASIEQAVCEVCRVSPKKLASKERGRDVAEPRMIAMWLARKYTAAALSEIGRKFGGRTHSTVVSAKNKVDQWMSEPGERCLASTSVRVHDAVRRIESMLRSG
jgi:chromosomal replication initiator protein